MDLTKKHCIPCEGGIPPMSGKEENKYMKKVKEWNLSRKGIHKISRRFLFRTFLQAVDFVNKIAKLAEKEHHHPDLHLHYNKLDVDLYTHAVHGLSENDFILAAKIDKLSKK